MDVYMKKDIFFNFALPLCIAVILTALIGLTNTDLEIEKLFYSLERGGWFMGQKMPWNFLYNYGNIPAILLASVGFLVFVLSFFRKTLLPYKKIGFFLAMFLVLGPGLIVNTVFKDHWGRPRPADIVNFGGTETFRQAWETGEAGQGKSFPSGHASVGFFLFAPFFFLRKSHQTTAWAFLGLGIIFGMFMGAGRMIQGGHFLTDIIWSGVFIYITGYILYYIFRFDREDALKTNIKLFSHLK
jgi:membrane-associated PAP2 superfamily phosphatase